MSFPASPALPPVRKTPHLKPNRSCRMNIDQCCLEQFAYLVFASLYPAWLLEHQHGHAFVQHCSQSTDFFRSSPGDPESIMKDVFKTDLYKTHKSALDSYVSSRAPLGDIVERRSVTKSKNFPKESLKQNHCDVKNAFLSRAM